MQNKKYELKYIKNSLHLYQNISLVQQIIKNEQCDLGLHTNCVQSHIKIQQRIQKYRKHEDVPFLKFLR